MDRKLHSILIRAGLIGCIMLGSAWYIQYCGNPYDYFTISTQQWWQNILLNVGAGVLTSIVFIYFFDMVLLKHSEKDKILKKKIAFSSLYKILDEHYRYVIYGMYRSAALTEREITTLDFLVSDEYFNDIQYLDFNKSPYLEKDDEEQTSVENYSFVPRNYQIIFDYNKRLTDYLFNEVLVIYGQFLEAEMCDLIQEFRFSPFVRYSYQLPQLTKWHSQPIFKAMAPLAVKDTIAPNGFDIKENEKLINAWGKHNEIFVKIVKLYNQSVSTNNKFNVAEIANKVLIDWGHCRIGDFKVTPGTYSLKQINGETDINKIVLEKVFEIEKQMKQVLDLLTK